MVGQRRKTKAVFVRAQNLVFLRYHQIPKNILSYVAFNNVHSILDKKGKSKITVNVIQLGFSVCSISTPLDVYKERRKRRVKLTKPSVRRCSSKKLKMLFLKISQYSQENACAGVSFLLLLFLSSNKE